MKPAAHQYEDKLLELAYGELPAHEASAVESHVRTCARCAEALSEIRAVRNTMGQLPMEPVPNTGLESLYAYADQAARRSAAGPAPVATWWRRFMAPLVAAGALSLIGVVAYKANEASPADTRAKVAEKVAQTETVKAAELNEAPSPPPAADPVVAVAPADPPVALSQTEAAQQEELKKPDAYRVQTVAKVAKPTMVAPKPSAVRGGELGDELMAAKMKGEGSHAPANGADPTAKNELAEKKAAPEPTNNELAMNYGGDLRNKMRKADEAQRDDSVGYKAGKDVRERKESSAYGLSTGTASGTVSTSPQGGSALGASQAGGAGVRGPSPSPPAEQVAANEPPPLQKQQYAPPPEPPARSSLGMSLDNAGSRGRGSMNQKADGIERESDKQQAVAAAPSAAMTPQQMVSDLESRLKASNGARVRGDTQTEVQIAMEILRDSHATSDVRLGALNNVCQGLTTLEDDRAYQYCQLLVREFPNSAQAQAYLQSQNRNIQRPAAPAKRAAKKESHFEDGEQRREAPPRPAAEPAAAPAAY